MTEMGSVTPEDALSFLDPELARMRRGVDLVHVLLDETYETDPIEIPAGQEREVVDRLFYHRLNPQLAMTIESGRVVVSDELRERIASSVMGLAVRRLALEGLVVEIAGAMESAGVMFLVLKGIATGRLDYADPSQRHTTDVDILVHRENFERAITAISSRGFTRRKELDLLDKGQSWEGPMGVVDVHTRPHAAGRFLGDHWWETSERFMVAGHELRALSRGGRLGHAASHYSVAYPNHRIMSSLLDVLTISRAVDDVARAEAERFLHDAGVGDITARITRRAASLLGEPLMILGQTRNRPLDSMLRRAYDRPDLDLAMVKLAKLLGMPWKERLGTVADVLVPSQDYLAAGGYKSRTDRVFTVVRRRWGRTTRE